MSRTILRRRSQEPFEIPPLPAVRVSGGDLRGALARFGRPVTTGLGPGERMIGGRVFYSAAWLDSSLFLSEPAEDVKGGDDGRDHQDDDHDDR
jgi:hypothetical protein